jgi:hypothetical protein
MPDKIRAEEKTMSESRGRSATKHVAEIGYSQDLRRIELVVPHGTKTTELSAIMSIVFRKEFIGRLPRGCTACTSGDHLLVREELADVIEVDLDRQPAAAP